MTVVELIRALQKVGARLSVEGEQLRVEAPRGTLEPELKTAIRKRKAELLELLRAGAGRASGQIVENPHRSRGPLSFAQERVWLFQALDPASTAYNLTPVVRLTGPLDRSRLTRAVEGVLERHHPLRTLIHADREPVQVVQPVGEVTVGFQDLSPDGEEGGTADFHALVEEQQGTPFELSREIPLRVTLVRRAEEVHDLVVTFHHVAVDGVSLPLFFQDLLAAYEGRARDPLPVQYLDFVDWQRGRWAGEALRSGLEYWRGQLAGAPQVLELPTDRPRGPSGSYSGQLVRGLLDRSTAGRLKTLAREEGASLFMALLPAFAATLHHHSGQRDMILGTPVTGRERSELGSLVGMFVNQLPIRARVRNGASFREMLQEARTTTLGSLSHQDLPFPLLVDELAESRATGVTPLFQAMLNVGPAIGGREGWVGKEVRMELPEMDELLTLFDGQSKFDLTLYGIERDDAIHLALVYNRELYSSVRMEGLLRDLETLVARVAESPDLPVDRHLLEVPSPRAGLPVDVPGRVPHLGPPGVESISMRLESVAQRYPDALAVVADDTSLTYGDLLEKVRGVALRVAHASDRLEGAVGVLLGQEAALAAGLLGVLRSGRPYVPLDTAYPNARLQAMVEDAGVHVVVTTPALARRARGLVGKGGVVVEVDGGIPPSGLDLPPMPGSEDLAYLLYTSGSTGRPKAVMQSHRNVVRQADRYARMLELAPGDRVALTASISFDACVMDLYGALLHGAALAPVDLRTTDLSRFSELADELGFTVLHITPTVFRTMARSAEQPRFPTVRAVDLGGEAVRGEDLAFFQQAFPEEAILVNSYGPSEHTLGLAFRVGRELDRHTIQVPIGWPVDDVEVLLLAEDGEVDPVRGEMVLRSRYGALGYWKRPELTEKAFSVDPDDDGIRMYRTGDVALRRPDGAFVFLHRSDQQMKVRGHRIEPGEVEAVLTAHPGVIEAAVHAPEDKKGSAWLVGCVVLGEEEATTVAELAKWCGERLPSYMIPTGWVVLATLPRTASGKVDRRALPSPQGTGEEGGGVAPRNPTEEVLLEIWTSVLDREGLGVTDDFFALGGHSLKAVEVVARTRDVLGVDLPLRALFDHPTIAGLAQWLQEQGPQRSLPPVGRVEDGTAVPLSFAQERLWVFQELDPEASTYNVVPVVRVTGPLDHDRMVRALRSTVDRHEPLRTLLVEEGGKIVQRVIGTPPELVEVQDVSGLEEEARATAARQAIEEARRRPFRPAVETPLRVLLVRRGPELHDLVLVFHHLAIDANAVQTFWRDLIAYYEGRSLPPLPVRYQDFVAWEREVWTRDRLDQGMTFWRSYLEGAPSVLELATDRPRPVDQTFRGGTCERSVEGLAFQKLLTLLQEEKSSLFMGLLAAFGAVLSFHTRQSDVVIGTPSTGRSRSELLNLVGMFANQLPLRVPVEAGATFRELLQATRRSALEGFGHQDLPFPLLLQELNPPRDRSRTPLFQAMLSMMPPAPEELSVEVKGVRFSAPDPEESGLRDPQARFDLTLVGQQRGGRLQLELVYNQDLFDPRRMAGLLEHVTTVLARGVEDPDQPLEAAAGVTAHDRTRLLEEWSEGEGWTEEREAFPAQVVKQARRVPHREAVDSPTGSWSYEELVREAGRITAALVEMGVGAGDRVGILMERSREMLGGLLGIQGAGAAYVPLDPGYPEARLRTMLEHSGARVLVTHRGLEARLGVEVPVLDLDRWMPPEPMAFRDTGPEEVAYLIYTSGSTGEPKGVEVPHGSVSNLLASMAVEPGLVESDRLLAVTTISFDIAGLELYLPLTVGACVVMAGEDETRDGAGLGERLESGGITVMQATPATWKVLLASGWKGRRELKVLCGGEALPGALAEALLERVGELWNMYGPTETTVWSTVKRMHRGEPVLIGRPIHQTVVRVLDAEKRLLPVGVPGELWIGGRGVALGYADRPELTAERFREDPFREGGRIYRTGDRVRWRAEGQLEHLGRLDHQVKVRGFRIELGEVESALRSHPVVDDVVVVAREETLVAYLIPGGGEGTFDPSELRSWVSHSLPGYMVPSHFVAMDHFPLTPNGKVDRGALPDPGAPSAGPHAPVSPRTPEEELLCQIWAEVLGLDQVGVFDNFFELGGHSLLAVQVTARVRDVLELEIPLKHLFDYPTVAETAEWLRNRAPALPDLPPLAPTGNTVPAPLSLAQERIWLFQGLDPEAATYNISSVLHLRGPADLERLDDVLRQIVQRHHPLRTLLRRVEGRLIQDVAPVPRRILRVENVTAVPEGERANAARELARAERGRPFRLAEEAPFRALLVRRSERRCDLVVTFHHTAVDATSVDLFLRELLELYDGRGLPELPVSYGDYAEWSRQLWKGERLRREQDVWHDRLEGAPMALELPTDRPRPASQTFSGGLLDRPLEEEGARALRALLVEERATLFMGLLAAFSASLHLHSGQRDMLLGTPVGGRTRNELVDMIGMFVNQLPLRMKVPRGASFRELLRGAREVAVEGYAHQEFPFAHLLEAVAPPRDMSRTPLFQALVNVLPPAVGGRERSAGGVTFSTPDAEELRSLFHPQSKFDLTLYGRAQGDVIHTGLVYNRDLFDESRMASLYDTTLTLLVEGAREPDRRLEGSIPAQTAASARFLEPAAAEEESAAMRFEAVARRHPNRPAVVDVAGTTTYGELLEAVDELASRVALASPDPDRPVGVLAGHDSAVAEGFLGVLRSGRPYVPLDASYPDARLRFMMEDAGVDVMVCSAGLQEQAAHLLGSKGRVVCIGAVGDGASSIPAMPAPDRLAYLLYTSGSTGVPKAVVQSQANVVRQADRYARMLELAPGDRVCLTASISFDACVMDLYGALLQGATLVPVDLRTTELRRLPEVASDRGLTVLHMTPTVFRTLVRSNPGKGFPTIRALVLGGEPVRSEDVASFDAIFPDGSWLVDLYGSAEHSFALGSRVDRDLHHHTTEVPMGWPVDDVEVILLTEAGEVDPVRGEMVLRSRYGALGYWNRRELTERAFSTDPTDAGIRMFRTGDVVRRRPDGAHVFLHRTDQQMKVRGHRIEPGEVEAILQSHPGVREAAVVAREDALVAYLVNEVEAPNVGALRGWMGERVPAYMVPSFFVPLDAFPLTPSGKVDRKRLPDPGQAIRHGEEVGELTEPGELVLAEVWGELLGVEGIQASDQFFELGGHSLLAMEAVARVEERTGHRMDPRALFFKTLGQLAADLPVEKVSP